MQVRPQNFWISKIFKTRHLLFSYLTNYGQQRNGEILLMIYFWRILTKSRKCLPFLSNVQNYVKKQLLRHRFAARLWSIKQNYKIRVTSYFLFFKYWITVNKICIKYSFGSVLCYLIDQTPLLLFVEYVLQMYYKH